MSLNAHTYGGPRFIIVGGQRKIRFWGRNTNTENVGYGSGTHYSNGKEAGKNLKFISLMDLKPVK